MLVYSSELVYYLLTEAEDEPFDLIELINEKKETLGDLLDTASLYKKLEKSCEMEEWKEASDYLDAIMSEIRVRNYNAVVISAIIGSLKANKKETQNSQK